MYYRTAMYWNEISAEPTRIILCVPAHYVDYHMRVLINNIKLQLQNAWGAWGVLVGIVAKGEIRNRGGPSRTRDNFVIFIVWLHFSVRVFFTYNRQMVYSKMYKSSTLRHSVYPHYTKHILNAHRGALETFCMAVFNPGQKIF